MDTTYVNSTQPALVRRKGLSAISKRIFVTYLRNSAKGNFLLRVNVYDFHQSSNNPTSMKRVPVDSPANGYSTGVLQFESFFRCSVVNVALLRLKSLRQKGPISICDFVLLHPSIHCVHQNARTMIHGLFPISVILDFSGHQSLIGKVYVRLKT